MFWTKRVLAVILALILTVPLTMLGYLAVQNDLVTRRVEKRREAHKQIKPGMTKAQVEQILGKPDEVLADKLKERWQYHAELPEKITSSFFGPVVFKHCFSPGYCLFVDFSGQGLVAEIADGAGIYQPLIQ